MKKEIYLYGSIICVIASTVATFFDWRISTGIIIGALASMLYLIVLNKTFRIENGQMSKGGAIGFILRILIIALPLLIAALIPNYFNIFGAFGGVMVFRIVMMIVFYKTKEEIKW